MTAEMLTRGDTLRDAVGVIERTGRFIAAVVDADRRLIGVVSDGDIRRTLLAGRDLDAPVSEVMNAQPITGSAAQSAADHLETMMRLRIAAIPLVDDNGRFERIVQLNDRAHLAPSTAADAGAGYAGAVIMAGGEGRRLYPLTAEIPKPMIDVGGTPLLERQIRALANANIGKIFISINYLGHIIEDYFGDGSRFDVRITYLRESQKLGTAGALSLLPDIGPAPILVMNGDVLTTSNFDSLLAFHRETHAKATVAASVYRVAIPYGVLAVDRHRAIGLEEKPTQTFLCNAGLYVLSPGVVAQVEKDKELNMTDLISKLITAEQTVAVFPIHEYWTDIGDPHDLERARQEFRED